MLKEGTVYLQLKHFLCRNIYQSNCDKPFKMYKHIFPGLSLSLNNLNVFAAGYFETAPFFTVDRVLRIRCKISLCFSYNSLLLFCPVSPRTPLSLLASCPASLSDRYVLQLLLYGLLITLPYLLLATPAQPVEESLLLQPRWWRNIFYSSPHAGGVEESLLLQPRWWRSLWYFSPVSN
jgi:hypothetical protein